MPLTPSEVAKLEEFVEASRLTEVVIDQDGIRAVIGHKPQESKAAEPVTIVAPVAGTVAFEPLAIGRSVSAGDTVARLSALDEETTVTASQSGRIAALLAVDGTLVGYGDELIQLDPEISA